MWVSDRRANHHYWDIHGSFNFHLKNVMYHTCMFTSCSLHWSFCCCFDTSHSCRTDETKQTPDKTKQTSHKWLWTTFRILYDIYVLYASDKYEKIPSLSSGDRNHSGIYTSLYCFCCWHQNVVLQYPECIARRTKNFSWNDKWNESFPLLCEINFAFGCLIFFFCSETEKESIKWFIALL